MGIEGRGPDCGKIRNNEPNFSLSQLKEHRGLCFETVSKQCFETPGSMVLSHLVRTFATVEIFFHLFSLPHFSLYLVCNPSYFIARMACIRV